MTSSKLAHIDLPLESLKLGLYEITISAFPQDHGEHIALGMEANSWPELHAFLWKNLTYVKVEHTSEFLFGSYWWTWKQTFKNCWSGPIKKQNNLIFTMLHFLQKSKKKNFFWENKKKHLEKSSCYTCTKNYDHMMYGSWDMVRDWQTDGQSDIYIDGCPT